MKIYNNFTELQKEEPEIAKTMLDNVGPGKWQHDVIYYHSDISSFAEHELTEGWYASSELGEDNYNGAPDPLDFADPNNLNLEDDNELWEWAEGRPVSDIVDYIDLEYFGRALEINWDESCNWTDGDVVLTSSYGWARVDKG